MTKHDLIASIAYCIWKDMVDAGLGEYSSPEGNWRIAEGICAWFEEPNDPEFVRTAEYERKREDFIRFQDLYDKYRASVK